MANQPESGDRLRLSAVDILDLQRRIAQRATRSLAEIPPPTGDPRSAPSLDKLLAEDREERLGRD